MRLRHPAPQQQDASLSGALDAYAQRVVATLLRELDAARQRGASAEAQLADVQRQREHGARARRKGQAGDKQQEQPKATGIQRRALPAGSGPAAPAVRIKAFRPPGQAPPPQHPNRPRSPVQLPAAGASAAEQAQVALQQENAELRGHLGALLSHFKQQVDASAAAAATGSHPPPAHPTVRSRQRQPAADEVAAAMPELYGSLRRRPGSPGRTTAVVLSPRAGGADLAVAVFEVCHCRVLPGLIGSWAVH